MEGQENRTTTRKFCSLCGGKLIPNSSFCGDCGAAVESSPSTASTSSPIDREVERISREAADAARAQETWGFHPSPNVNVQSATKTIPTKSRNSGLRFFWFIPLPIGLVIWLVFGSSIMESNADTAAQEARKQFDMSFQHGADNQELCMRAGVVAELYLNAHDEDKYGYWKTQKDKYCYAAQEPLRQLQQQQENNMRQLQQQLNQQR